MTVFVSERTEKETPRAISHFESLWESTCKKRSGERMSCMSCHDPHVMPSAQERVTYFRARCLACHSEVRFQKHHHPETPDCTSCHMPRIPSRDVGHTVLTDHRIPRRPEPQQRGTAGTKLVAFGGQSSDSRTLGLAYAQLADGGDPQVIGEAVKFLSAAVRDYPKDAEVLSRLGYLLQSRGEIEQAASLYERALKEDPSQITATINLAVIEARRHELGRSISLWRSVFDQHPDISEVGIDLGVAFCATGDAASARSYLQRSLEFNPDLQRAKKMLHALESGAEKCSR